VTKGEDVWPLPATPILPGMPASFKEIKNACQSLGVLEPSQSSKGMSFSSIRNWMPQMRTWRAMLAMKCLHQRHPSLEEGYSSWRRFFWELLMWRIREEPAFLLGRYTEQISTWNWTTFLFLFLLYTTLLLCDLPGFSVHFLWDILCNIHVNWLPQMHRFGRCFGGEISWWLRSEYWPSFQFPIKLFNFIIQNACIHQAEKKKRKRKKGEFFFIFFKKKNERENLNIFFFFEIMV